MKFAVFFRNLNLGRPPAPTRPALESAFEESGAVAPQSFLTNGTLVFEAANLAAARRTLARAQALLAVSGFQEPAALRKLDDLAALVDSEPFGQVATADAYAVCATFLTAKPKPGLDYPLANAKGDVQAVAWQDGLLLSLSYKHGSSPGDPNGLVERSLGVPATTRVWNTVVRLVQKHRA
jgi:uncharacterized protein (DUF1697 family)